MNTMVLAAQAAGAQGGGLGMLVMMVAIFVIMWLFMIRPQQKKQKEQVPEFSCRGSKGCYRRRNIRDSKTCGSDCQHR